MKKFIEWVLSSSAAIRYMLVCTALAGGYFVLQKLHHRDGVADFRVYYDAATAFLNGNSPYGSAFGVSSGFYKYAPLALLPFVFFSLLPYPVASGIYYFLVLIAFIGFSLALTYFLEKRLNLPVKRRGWVLAAITLFMADHFERELHLGNVNVFLLIGSFLLFDLRIKGRTAQGGLLYSAMLLFKPHFAILIPYFILRKEWKLLGTAAGGVGVGLLLPSVIAGWRRNLDLVDSWFGAMLDHNVHLSESPNTVYGIVQSWLLSPFGVNGGIWLVAILLAVVAVAYLLLIRSNEQLEVPVQSGFMEFFVLIALIPNLAHTDTEHFMWTWPLVAFVFLQLINQRLPSTRVWWIIIALAFIPYAVNSPDIVGRRVMLLFDEGGLLGFANLMIIGTAIAMHRVVARLAGPTKVTQIAS